MILASSLTLVAAPAAASPVQSASNQTSGLSAAGSAAAGPLLVPGTYVTFTCTHGTISLGGVQYCSHTTTAPRDLCDSPSCPFSMKGTVDSGYTFYGWQLGGGQVSVSCGSCLSTTLTLHTPNLGDVYSVSVTLDTTPPPPPTVEVTIVTFENWSTDWTPAEVHACLSGTCSNATNGQILKLYQNKAYTISAVALQYGASFSQWATDAGSLSNNASSPTTFTPTKAGDLTLIAEFTPSPWIGYVDSTCGACNSVSGMFTMPAVGGTAGVGMWVGIGGLRSTAGTYTNLLQAGVQFNISSQNSSGIHAFYVECTGPNVCSGPTHYNWTFAINPLDVVFISVVNIGGTSYEMKVRDPTLPHTPTWYVNVSFTPNTDYVEWIDEPLQAGIFDPIPLFDLMAMGQAQTINEGLLAVEYPAKPYYAIVTPLEMGSTFPGVTSIQFSIEHT